MIRLLEWVRDWLWYRTAWLAWLIQGRPSPVRLRTITAADLMAVSFDGDSKFSIGFRPNQWTVAQPCPMRVSGPGFRDRRCVLDDGHDGGHEPFAWVS